MSDPDASCYLCDNPVEFACVNCQRHVCGTHGRIRVLCTACLEQARTKREQSKHTIGQATCEDVSILEHLVVQFWGDPVQLMFNHRFKVTEQPALVARINGHITGFLFYHPFREAAVLIVALGVLPRYQGCGIGQELLQRIEEYARSEGKRELLVVTSNDNLPALAFYQRNGFQLYEVAPDVIAHKLGGFQLGIGSIPIRDELRLRKVLTTA